MKRTIIVAFSLVAIASQPGHAQGLAGAEEVQIRTQQLADDLYILFFETGGNLLVSIGEQGVLIVDDQFQNTVAAYQAKIRELGGGDIDLVVNTHWHYDHAQGNLTLGPEGAWIVSHANSREMMTRDNLINVVTRSVNQPAYETAALPVATFDDTMQIHFNGERIDLVHFGRAHTTGDAAVILRNHNVVHLGDVFNTSAYPFIDADNGGHVDGVIQFCEAVLMQIDEDTIVVPGHGEAGTYADLRNYVDMVRTVRNRIAALVEDGASLDEVIAANPTADWDD
ncbi:MAG: MBL fold metallo-hydrolase, partial [Gammaproteobacteria bacterium]|nr:MBL fold metallo-hydrolase [Gammaproteobacteria bacterium]